MNPAPVQLAEMMRKATLLVLAFVLIGIAPLTAVLGFCAKLPCCFADSHDDVTVKVSRPDCCDPVSCSDTQVQELALSKDGTTLVKTVAPAADVASFLSIARIVSARSFDELPPPRTSQKRLSSLSLLLI